MPVCSRPVIALAFALVLGACATASVEERTAACQATDWHSYGQNDGILGVAPGARDKKFADCAELGFPADIATYRAGRDRGLIEYCTLENGYEVGYEGRRYRKACPSDLEVAFLQGYQQGRKDRPTSFYPSVGFGFGYGHFGSSYLWHRHHFHRHRHRYHSRSKSGDRAK